MKIALILLGIIISTFVGRAQEIEIVCQEQPLSSLLVDLREQYQLQFSYDDEYLSKFKITCSRKFTTPEKAFEYILKDLPVTYEKVGGVFLFYKNVPKPVLKTYRLAGRFSDPSGLEALPYTHLIINNTNLVTDQYGNFSFQSQRDSLFKLQASYLGYSLLDTTVYSGSQHQFVLKPANFKLEVVEVKGLRLVKSLQVGNYAGVMRLNHQVANYLPGNSDNSVFNLLRLQPGILAAGEQSNDLIIWGSYEGQTQVLFDGFTLFGMKNFNDNISAVNPFMAKDIQVLKGAYDAEHGGRVGGLVNITGTDGDIHSPKIKLSANNMTLNGMLSLPIAEQSAFTVAFRQTYYELYDSQQLSFQTGRSGRGQGQGQGQDSTQRTIYPDYNFRDLNLKYSGTGKSGDSYNISTLVAEDKFYNTLANESETSKIAYEDHEHNKQYGGSAFYQKIWKNGDRTRISIAYSSLQKELRTLRKVGFKQAGTGSQKSATTFSSINDGGNPGGAGEPGGADDPGGQGEPGGAGDPGGTGEPGGAGEPGGTGGSGEPGGAEDPGGQGEPGGPGGPNDFNTVINEDESSFNQVSETSFLFNHHLSVGEKHQIDFGASLILDEVKYREDSFLVRKSDQKFDGSRVNGVIQESFSPASGVVIKLGMRANYSVNLGKTFVQPRFSTTIDLTENIKFNAGWGLHNQFISRSSLVDQEGNYHFLWSVCDDQSIPVLESRHLVLGLNFHKNNFNFSIEGFDKRTKGLTRYVENFSSNSIFNGDSKSRGLDFFMKQDYRGHSAWLSYSLSETLEKFDYFTVPEYSRALHDQRHELKAAFILNFNPFHFSGNYVFGSGFPDPRQTTDGGAEQSYRRLDVSATYTLTTKRITLEGGISILNVLNNSNLKYANFIRLPEDQETTLDLHAQAIPFTPALFLIFSF